jgi:hypothetical protein
MVMTLRGDGSPNSVDNKEDGRIQHQSCRDERAWPAPPRLEHQIKARGPVNYCPLCPGARAPLTVPAPAPSPDRRRTSSRPGSVKGRPKGRRKAPLTGSGRLRQ